MKKIKEFIKQNYILCILLALFILCFAIPIIRLGIMHNDELMSRYWSSQGFFAFYKHYFIEQIEKGRALSCVIIPFTMYLGFLGQKTFLFKIAQILSIIICSLLFGKLLYKVFKNKKLSIIYTLLFLIFLPISYEPTVPNVFVTFYNVSLCFLIISFMLYHDYLEEKSSKKLVLSMILFFIVELSYEAFVTYTPIFVLLYLNKSGLKLKNILKDKKGLFFPIITGIIYLILYVIVGKLFPSNYSGNQIDGINIITSLKIIYNLGIYTLPGSYILSDKYQWLFKQYYSFNICDIIRVVSIVVLFLLIVLKIFKNPSQSEIEKKSIYKSVFLGACSVVLPLLPISVASMYQNMAIGENTLGLPVSFFSYFGSIFIVAIVTTYILENTKKVKFLFIILISIGAFAVQIMNDTFSHVAYKDFKRIEYIESFVSSDIFKKMDNMKVYSKDLFIVKDALFVHDSYWNEYVKLRGIKTEFINDNGNENDIKLYYLEKHQTFELVNKDKYYLITNKKLKGNMKIYNKENKKQTVNISNKYSRIDNWYIYSYEDNCQNIVQCDKILSGKDLFND